MSDTPLEQWLRHLENLHPNAVELGLERVSRVAHSLGLLPVARPVVTVAGTNGKGSAVAVLDSVLTASGLVTGCFTSPHFARFNERIRVAGEEASDREIVAAFELIEAARETTSLTYFEFSTLAALLVFRNMAVDVTILEVGLGGRLDSTNMVDPDIAVITSIALDHQDWLGDNREAIAREKAGIMRANIPVIIADSDPPSALIECARRVGAEPVLRLGEGFGFADHSGRPTAWVTTPDGQCRAVPRGGPPGLLADNIVAGLQAAILVRPQLSDEEIQRGLAGVRMRGRRQLQEMGDFRYLLDVAHNPASVYKMLEYIDATDCNGKIFALFSAMKDKAVDDMLDLCGDRFDAWFVADQPDNQRAMAAPELDRLLRARDQVVVSVSESVGQAFHRARSTMAAGDTLVVFGSFFTVAGVLPLLEQDHSADGA